MDRGRWTRWRFGLSDTERDSEPSAERRFCQSCDDYWNDRDVERIEHRRYRRARRFRPEFGLVEVDGAGEWILHSGHRWQRFRHGAGRFHGFGSFESPAHHFFKRIYESTRPRDIPGPGWRGIRNYRPG